MNYIKKYRAIKGLSQSELANAAGVSRTYLSYLEQNSAKRKLTAELAESIANVLECNIVDLFGDDVFYVVPKNDYEVVSLIKHLAKKISNENLKNTLLDLVKNENTEKNFSTNDLTDIKEHKFKINRGKELILKLMKEENLKVEELAEKCGITSATIRNILNNKFSARPDTILAIVKVFNLEFDDYYV